MGKPRVLHEKFPWEWGSPKHIKIQEERRALLDKKFNGTLNDEDAYRLACIRGILDAIEQGYYEKRPMHALYYKVNWLEDKT